MKKLFLSLVALAMATMSYAQSTLVATLTHGDNIKMFYGAYALRDAHNAAANGDIINLSSGAFQSVKIAKALTIRGTGCRWTDTPTNIVNEVEIEIPSAITDRLSIEACDFNKVYVKGTLTNAQFMRCVMDDFFVNDNANMKNGTFTNCVLYGMSLQGSSSVNFVNSELTDFCNYAEETASAYFINCNIKPFHRGSYGSDHCDPSSIGLSILVNCILWADYGWGFNSYSLPSTTSAYNCVAVGNNAQNVFKNCASQQNCQLADFDIFQEGHGWDALTDEAKAKYIGTDGKPVGDKGGALPLSFTPTYPQITKMNVASKTTADGKLSVEIEVSATEE